MRHPAAWVCILSILVLSAMAQTLAAGTVTLRDGLDGYSGTQDATIASNTGTPSDSHIDGGQAVQESWGSTLPTSSPPYDTTRAGGSWSTALLRFDDIFTSFAQIPSGATIDSAILSVYVTNPIEGTQLAVMTTGWDESTVTWSAFGSGSPASGGGVTPGVDAASAMTSLGTLPLGPTSIDVTSTVQSWLDNPGTNFGWAFLRDDKNKGLFVAAEDTVDPTQRPTLTVAFTVPEPSTISLMIMAAVCLLPFGLRRLRQR